MGSLGIFDPGVDPGLKCGLFDLGIFKPECWFTASTGRPITTGAPPTPVAPGPPNVPASVVMDPRTSAPTVRPDLVVNTAVLTPAQIAERTQAAIDKAIAGRSYCPWGGCDTPPAAPAPAGFDLGDWISNNTGLAALIGFGGLVFVTKVLR